MTIKKLFKYIVLMVLAVPCIASDDGLYAKRSRENYLLKLGVVKPQEIINKRASVKEFVLKDLPKPGYREKKDENAYIIFMRDMSTCAKKSVTLDFFEACRIATQQALIHGYQLALKLLLENVKENTFVQIVLSDSLIAKELRKLDKDFPGISEYVRKLAILHPQ